MKEIKQKPAGGKPKTADAARVPKAVVKAAWLQAREAARAGEKQVVGGKDGAYSGAADTGEKGADKLVSTGERVTELAYRGGRKLAERSAGQRRERAKAAQTGGEAAQRHGAGETIAHTSTIEASRPPQTREAGRVSDENRPAGARPQQRESRAVGRAKPIKPGREMKQGAPGPKTTEQAGKARQAVQAAARNGQAKARFTQRAQQTAKRAVDTTKRATDAARAGMRALVEALHSLLIALAAGGSVAVLIVVLICLIAFVAGSAYGIFFAAEAPGEDAFTVQQAVEQLGGEYRDYLQQIESTMPHDRQEIKANDDVYYIRWQDVLAVFSSYVSGAEDGAPVAYLDESRLQQLRQTMWDMWIYAFLFGSLMVDGDTLLPHSASVTFPPRAGRICQPIHLNESLSRAAFTAAIPLNDCSLKGDALELGHLEGDISGSGGEIAVVVAAAIPLTLLITLIPGSLGQLVGLRLQQFVERLLYTASYEFFELPLDYFLV